MGDFRVVCARTLVALEARDSAECSGQAAMQGPGRGSHWGNENGQNSKGVVRVFFETCGMTHVHVHATSLVRVAVPVGGGGGLIRAALAFASPSRLLCWHPRAGS